MKKIAVANNIKIPQKFYVKVQKHLELNLAFGIILSTSNKQQATSNKQQATSNKQQATSNKLNLALSKNQIHFYFSKNKYPKNGGIL